MWDAKLYDDKHSFVWKHGASLVELLSPKPGESVLDLGCGTGHLTAQIAEAVASVLGIDSSPQMIDEARRIFPDVRFEVQDARSLPYTEQFDAVFSNAALHWIKEAEQVVQGVSRALKPGGRFVAEFGGKGNVQAILAAVRGLQQVGVEPESPGFTQASASTPDCWNEPVWKSPSPLCSTDRRRWKVQTGFGIGSRCSEVGFWSRFPWTGGKNSSVWSRTNCDRLCIGTGRGLRIIGGCGWLPGEDDFGKESLMLELMQKMVRAKNHRRRLAGCLGFASPPSNRDERFAKWRSMTGTTTRWGRCTAASTATWRTRRWDWLMPPPWAKAKVSRPSS